METLKELGRWIALPITFFLAKPAASLLMWFQSWYSSPDSFYAVTISPILSYLLTGFLLLYFAYEIAPRGKIIVTGVYFGILITLTIVSFLIVGSLDSETFFTAVGLIAGLVYLITDERKRVN